MRHLWIMGCGDIGRRVASLYQKQGRRVIGWVRSEESVRLGEECGILMRQGDLDAGVFFDAEQFEGAEVFWFIPPGPKRKIPSVSPLLKGSVHQKEEIFTGAPPPLAKGERGGFTASAGGTNLSRFLAIIKNAPCRITMISTTSVYGDCQGRWIDESEPLKPKAERAIRRVDAETALQDWAKQYNRECVILRVPGIYAQDRLPLARLRRGEPVLTATEAPWTNRIHADDLAMVCQVAMEKAAAGSIYNATDGHPSTMTDYFNSVADFAGLPRPPQVSLAEAQDSMSAGMLSYLAESRRIGNEKLLAELGVELRYPALSYGLSQD